MSFESNSQCNWKACCFFCAFVQVRDMSALVRRDRSHPCVFVWNLCNEASAKRGKKKSEKKVRGNEYKCGTGVVGFLT